VLQARKRYKLHLLINMEGHQAQTLEANEGRLTISMEETHPIHLPMKLMRMSSGIRHRKQLTSGEDNTSLVTAVVQDIRDHQLEVLDKLPDTD